jgi:hypothetical protein
MPKKLKIQIEVLQQPEMQPWHRLPEESWAKYQFFLAYLQQAPAVRTPSRAFFMLRPDWEQMGKKAPGWIFTLAKKYRWKERAEAYDRWREERAKYVLSEQLEEAIKIRKEVIQDALNLRQALLDRAQKLLERVDSMLQFPVAEEKSEDGKTVVKPAKWNFRDVAQVLSTLVEVGKFATEIGVRASQESERDEDITRLPDEQLLAKVKPNGELRSDNRRD